MPFRMDPANWDKIDPTNIPDRAKYCGESAPWTPEELARIEAFPGDEWDPPGPAAETEAERLHAFGNKDRPRPPRLEGDLEAESWDSVVGPYSPTDPTDEDVHGVSTFTDPYHSDVKLNGKFHRLPPDYQPPEESGLAIHADGRDVDVNAPQPWGHRLIYPTIAMTAAEFAQRVADLPWEYAGNKKKES